MTWLENGIFSDLAIYYPGLHTVDEEIALQIILKDKFYII